MKKLSIPAVESQALVEAAETYYGDRALAYQRSMALLLIRKGAEMIVRDGVSSLLKVPNAVFSVRSATEEELIWLEMDTVIEGGGGTNE
jgi:methionine synthase I (cobalamin-dependent)